MHELVFLGVIEMGGKVVHGARQVLRTHARLQPGEKGGGISTVVSWKEVLVNAKIALQSTGVLRPE